MGLPKQFVLGRTEPLAPPGWVRREVGDWHLAHAPDLPCQLVHGGDHLLGWPVGPANDLGGRGVRISGATVTLDPFGSYSVVYHPSGVVASSTAVVPPGLLDEDAALGLPEKDNWYPFGLTPYADVRRLLPGHALSLREMRAVRGSPAGFGELADADVADVVARSLRDHFNRLAADYRIVMGLTAGNESRMLLAALRGLQDQVDTFTIESVPQDVRTARALARRFGFAHRVEGAIRDPDAERVWFDRVGRCVAGATLRNAGIKTRLRTDAVFVKGIGGEIGRGYYYRPDDRPGTALTPDDLLDRMRLPTVPALVRAADAWLRSVSPSDVFGTLDRLYLENRVGCWAAPQLHGDVAPLTTLWPLNRPSTLQAMLSLSAGAKRADRLCPMVVERLWPDLLTIPINAPFGVGRVGGALRRGARWVRRALRSS